MASELNVNWYAVVASSAVISALVNVSWSAWLKRNERIKEDVEKSRRIGHVYLDIALDLESFAKRGNAYLFDIQDGLFEFKKNHNNLVLSKLKPLKFEFNVVPSWSELPVAFVARVKTIPLQFESTNEWIVAQWAGWADLDEVYQLEEERVAFYGLKICEIATKIRLEIGASEDETSSYVEHFKSILKSRRAAFQQQGEALTLIPELHAQFKKEQANG